MESRIFGHITQLVGNVIARDSDGNERELMLGDAIYFGEQVICLDDNSEVVVSVAGYDQDITLAGNEAKLFDASLRDAAFLIEDVESDDAEEDESEDEDDIEAPSAGEEDVEDESEGSAQFSARKGDQTDINSGLRDANFSQRQPEVEYKPAEDDDQLRSHGSFAINQKPDTIAPDNSPFSEPKPDIVKPPTIPDIIKPKPPVVIIDPSTPEPDGPIVVPKPPAIINSLPVAIADLAQITEDAQPNVISGNVFSNDSLEQNERPQPVTDVNGQGIGTVVTGEFGSIVINGDGSYSYTLNNDDLRVQKLIDGDTLSDVFEYTITDSTGDKATSTITVVINGVNDGVTLTFGDNDPDSNNSTERVYEGDLADSNNPDSSASTNSSFSLKANDGLAHITIAGQQISLAQLEALAQTNITITTSKGTITLNGYDIAADGTITLSYKYQLTDNVDHANGPVNDLIEITVTDRNNDSTTGTLSIAITDDLPQAEVDTNTIDEKSDNINGNVFTNDDLGADDHDSPVSGVVAGETADNITDNITDNNPATVTGQYGSLVMNADGTYTYTLNNSNREVQQLSDQGTLEDTFSYTITDSDGNQSTTTLTITINGVDNQVTLNIVDNVGGAGGDQQQVFESGLTDGSAPSGNEKSTVTSSFSFETPDALHSLTIHNTKITVAQLTELANKTVSEIEIITDKGVLTLTKAELSALSTNTVTYSYQLKEGQDHNDGDSDANTDADVTDAISITVIDYDGSLKAGTLNIAIIDDAPDAKNDAVRNVAEGGQVITGNVIVNTSNDSGNDILSADKDNTITAFTYTDQSGDDGTVGVLGQVMTTEHGSLTVNANGSWSYTSGPIVDHGQDQGSVLSDNFRYTLTDGDGDSDDAIQSISIVDGNDVDTNPLVIVYEGAGESIFDGSLSYDKSASTEAGDTTSIKTTKLVITDNGTIDSFSFASQNATITGSSATISDNELGSVTVYSDGTWHYTPPASATHDSATRIDHLATSFSYTIVDGNGANVNIGYQHIKIDDTIATIDAVDDTIIHEQYLVAGSTPDGAKTTKTGTITVDKQADSINVAFDTSQATIDALTAKNLSSDAQSLMYIFSNEHTLTATSNEIPIFIVTIINPDNVNTVGYSVQLLKPLAHEILTLNTDGDFEFDLPIKVTDGDGDVDTSSFTLTIVDDNPVTSIMTINEDSEYSDSGNTIATHADVTKENTSTAATYGAAKINDDGSLSYKPNPDFSGTDTITYTTTLADGTTKVTTVTITVRPEADAPTNLITSASLQTQEDTVVALGLKRPSLSDTSDDSGNADDMDNSERYGPITLTGIPDKAELSTTSGATINLISDGGDIIIVLVDDNNNLINKHISGLDVTNPSAIRLTVEQYESLQLLPPLDSHNNINVTVSVTSFEVDNTGAVISGVNGLDGAETQSVIAIDVQAVTDEVTLTSSATEMTINEDASLDLDVILTAKYGEIGDISDVSEKFSYTISNVPEDSTLTINGASAEANGSGDVTVFFTGASPSIEFTPPADFSGDILGMTITLKAIDTDDDSTDANPLIIEESAQVTLNLYVEPLANDITLASASGFEDTNIAFLAGLSDNDTGTVDGVDKITKITIEGIEKDLELTTDDGTNLYTSVADGGSFTIVIGTTNNPQTSNPFTLTEVQGLLLDTHRDHSSLDVKLDITVESTDTNTVHGSTVTSTTNTLYTTANGNPFTVTINAVSESKTNSNGDGNIDIITQGDRSYNNVSEDGSWIDLNTPNNGTPLDVTNEDDTNNGTTPYKSEKTEINFSNVPVGSMFEYTLEGNITTLTVQNIASGVDVPLAALGTVRFMPAGQYSGAIAIKMAVKTTDYDEDTNAAATPVFSTPDTLTLTVDPVADAVTLAIKQAIGDEDAGRSKGNSAGDIDAAVDGIDLDITTSSDDKDGSEVFELTIEKIPDGASIYYNGLLFNKGSVAAGGLTAVDEMDSTWTLTVSNFDSAVPLKYIPVHNSDENTTLDISATSDDGGASNSTPTIQLEVAVNAIADLPTGILLKGFDVNGTSNDPSGIYNLVTTEALVDGASNQIDLSLIYQTPNALASYDNDTSESLTVVISGLDPKFDLVGGQYIGGTGSGRRWILSADDVSNLKVITPENFSGEIALNVSYITTELNGSSITHSAEDVTLLVTPSAEATITNSTTANEDVLTKVNFELVVQNNDNDETVDSIRINKAELGLTNLTLYVGNSTALTLDGAVSSNPNISDDGTHYILTNGSFNDIYVLGDSDLHSSNSFEVLYGIKDTATITSGTATDVSSVTLAGKYIINIAAVTDAIDVNLSNINGGIAGTVTDSTVLITNNTTVTVDVTVKAAIHTNGPEADTSDIDGSETVARLVIENVPSGVTVAGGIYAGDIGNSSSNSGVWFIDLNDLPLSSTNGITHTVSFIVNGDAASFNTSTIKIIAYNEDDANGQYQNDFQLITLEKDSGYGGSNTTGTPPNITDFSIKALDIKEDTSFTLDQLILATISASGEFSILLKDLPAGTDVTGSSVQAHGDFWVISGNGDSAAIATILAGVTITPPANFSSNDAGSEKFTLNATITTYHNNSHKTDSLAVDQPVFALTDPIVIAVTGDNATDEDVTQIFKIDLSNTADGANAGVVDNKLYIKVTEAYSNSSENGTLTDGADVAITTKEVDPAGLATGTYYVISNVNANDSLNFKFTPGSNSHGSVDIDVFVISKESQSLPGHPDTDTAEVTSTHNYSFVVNSVLDGNTPVANNVTGTEDALIAGNPNWVKLDLSTSSPDSSEALVATLLDNIPTNFQIFYPDPNSPGDYLLAVNSGTSAQFGEGFNQWSVPLNVDGLINDIYIQAPENWSGSLTGLTALTFITISQEPGETGYISNDTQFDLTIAATTDTITLSPTKTFGLEGQDIAINLNAAMSDIDGSETMTLTLQNLGANANFKLAGVEIEDGNFSYASGTDTYTINNIAFDDINNLSVVQQDTGGIKPITITAITVETANGASSTAANATFTIDISPVIATSGDDQLLYKTGVALNGQAGSDSLVLLENQGIDFASVNNLSNIEQLDLTANGNHQLQNLSFDDVVSLAGTSKLLTILGDSADIVSFSNATSKNWSKSGTETIDSKTFDVYSNSGDPTVKVNVQLEIDDSIG